MPPRKEETIPSPNALPGSPFFVMGYPSNTVATDAGVPGIPISVAVINPPDVPPIYSPVIMVKARSGDMA